jgi:hypothetical protein
MSQKISVPASKSTTSMYTKWFVTFICWVVYKKHIKQIPTLWKRKKASLPPDFNNFQNSVTHSEGTINALIRRAKFSPSVVGLVCSVRFSNGYYYSEALCSTFTNWYPPQHAVYEVTLMVHCASASRSSRKWSPLHSHIHYVLPNCIRS